MINNLVYKSVCKFAFFFFKNLALSLQNLQTLEAKVCCYFRANLH